MKKEYCESCSICESKLIDKAYHKSVIKQAVVLILAMIALILVSCRFVHADGCSEAPIRIKHDGVCRINKQKAILAIIGEGEGENYAGKLALAYTIINRGTFKGVYGLRSKRVLQHKYSEACYQQAKRAWEYAIAHPSLDWTATGWGNETDIVLFNKTKWFSKCHITDHIGRHYFYACTSRS